MPLKDAVAAARGMPLNQNGGDRKTEEGKSGLPCKAEKYGNNQSYLLRRLSRDHPEALDRLKNVCPTPHRQPENIEQYRRLSRMFGSARKKVESPLIFC